MEQDLEKLAEKLREAKFPADEANLHIQLAQAEQLQGAKLELQGIRKALEGILTAMAPVYAHEDIQDNHDHAGKTVYS